MVQYKKDLLREFFICVFVEFQQPSKKKKRARSSSGNDEKGVCANTLCVQQEKIKSEKQLDESSQI
jgi:hypothetical protein